MYGALESLKGFNKAALEVLETNTQTVFLSSVSSWELVIKATLGKLTLPKKPAEFIAEALERFSIHPLSITPMHSLGVGELALHHRDPFDRMLVAQARSENMVLMTADRNIEKYPVEILWCRK